MTIKTWKTKKKNKNTENNKYRQQCEDKQRKQKKRIEEKEKEINKYKLALKNVVQRLQDGLDGTSTVQQNNEDMDQSENKNMDELINTMKNIVDMVNASEL